MVGRSPFAPRCEGLPEATVEADICTGVPSLGPFAPTLSRDLAHFLRVRYRVSQSVMQRYQASQNVKERYRA